MKTYAQKEQEWGSWRRGLARLGRREGLMAEYSFGFPHAITWTVESSRHGNAVKAILRISKNGAVHAALSAKTMKQDRLGEASYQCLIEWRDYLIQCLNVEMGMGVEPRIKPIMANATLSLPAISDWTVLDHTLQQLRKRREDAQVNGSAVILDPFRRMRVRGYDIWDTTSDDAATMFLWFVESGRVILNGRAFMHTLWTARRLVHMTRT